MNIITKQKEETPQAVGVSADVLNGAIEAVVKLIVETLNTKHKGKFAEAARLCTIGQSLIRTQAKKVEDFAVLEVHEGDDRAEDMPVERINLRDGLYNNRAPDERELLRNVLLTFGPHAQVSAEAHKATIAAQEAQELQTLQAYVQSIPDADPRRYALQTRITQLMTNMEMRNNANAPPAQMVPADVSRRHSAGENGAEVHDIARLRADAERREGNDGAAGEGREEHADQQAVG